MKTRALGSALSALFSVALLVSPVAAHDTDCPLCSRPVMQDTAVQDNETALRFGRKRIEYRCVFCALSEAHSQYKGDLTVLAPSEIKGKPVEVSRKAGRWSVLPQGAVFVGVGAGHAVCPTTFRAFSTRAAFDTYVAKHADLLKNAAPLTLAQMIAVAAKSMPTVAKGK